MFKNEDREYVSCLGSVYFFATQGKIFNVQAVGIRMTRLQVLLLLFRVTNLFKNKISVYGNRLISGELNASLLE